MPQPVRGPLPEHPFGFASRPVRLWRIEVDQPVSVTVCMDGVTIQALGFHAGRSAPPVLLASPSARIDPLAFDLDAVQAGIASPTAVLSRKICPRKAMERRRSAHGGRPFSSIDLSPEKRDGALVNRSSVPRLNSSEIGFTRLITGAGPPAVATQEVGRGGERVASVVESSARAVPQHIPR